MLFYFFVLFLHVHCSAQRARRSSHTYTYNNDEYYVNRVPSYTWPVQRPPGGREDWVVQNPSISVGNSDHRPNFAGGHGGWVLRSPSLSREGTTHSAGFPNDHGNWALQPSFQSREGSSHSAGDWVLQPSSRSREGSSHSTGDWVFQPSSLSREGVSESAGDWVFQSSLSGRDPSHSSGSGGEHSGWTLQRSVPAGDGSHSSGVADDWVLQPPSETEDSSEPSASAPTEQEDGWVLQNPDSVDSATDPAGTPEIPTAGAVPVPQYPPAPHENSSEHEEEKAGLLETDTVCAQGLIGSGDGTPNCVPPSASNIPAPSVSDGNEAEPNRYAFVGREFVLINETASPADFEDNGQVDDTTEVTPPSENAGALDPEPTSNVSQAGEEDTSAESEQGVFSPRTDGLMWKYPNCPLACEEDWVGDNWCDLDCNVEECGHDGGDCQSWCNPDCPSNWLGDGECDPECDNDACEKDGGDCAASLVENSVLIEE